MEHRGSTDFREMRDLGAARRRFPSGSLVRILEGRHRGELAVVEGIDEATFHELGEIVVWLDRSLGAAGADGAAGTDGADGAGYEPCSVMLAEIMLMQVAPQRQALRSRSSGVRKRGVTRTGPSRLASRSAAVLTEDAAS